MNLNSLFKGVFVLLVGLCCIVRGIRIYKQNIIFSNTSERERYFLLWSIYSVIEFAFIEKYKFDYLGFIIAIVPIAIFLIYIIYSRLYDVKYRIYNIEVGKFKDILTHTLDENGVEYSESYDWFETKGTSMYIELIDKGFLLKRCKKMPNYKIFLSKLEANLKNAEVTKKKKSLATSILAGIVFIILGILFLSIAFRHY